MNKKILIVEDEFMIANDLQMMLSRAGYAVSGIAASVQQAQQLISKEKPSWVLLDIFLKGKETGITLGHQLNQERIPFLYLSANSNDSILEEAKATQPYGFLLKPFREKDVLVSLDVARHRHLNSLESKLQEESKLQKKLMAIQAETGGWDKKLLSIIKALQTLIPFDFVATGIQTADAKSPFGLSYSRVGSDEYQLIGTHELLTMTGLKLSQLSAVNAIPVPDQKAGWYNEVEFQRKCQPDAMQKLLAKTFRLSSAMVLPVPMADAKPVLFSFYSRQPNAYAADHLAAITRLLPTLSLILAGLVPEEKKVTVSLERVVDSDRLLEKEKSRLTFGDIIGSSHSLKKVLSQVTQVAASDTSVLILGESGTGKELIARALHNSSSRKDKLMVKVNCAALPANLIESELFGHEKGAFTGALNKRIGKFELAHGGTLFLDEIGEMSPDLQVKLLRVLQEKEIERIGGNVPIKINTRIIAATNRNLHKEVQEGRFRLDLFYRLNVFPITLPPLRDRKEDIPELVRYFITFHASKVGKKITNISDAALQELMDYNWPGNIRELEHLVERSMLLTSGTVIREIFLQQAPETHLLSSEEERVKTLDEQERDYIMAILKKCNGKVWGKGGAAEQLNLPPSTLYSKIDRLGIKRKYAIELT